MMKKCIT